ncbi:ABC-three component system protein [Limibacillus halophilus]|uniref:ABC-three component systems C-terminal domain-containing protein n=1 Tax=Limibacillus halophilus TaxID=1579333 RepID=A0A839SWI3_9PROT|nr:ABC-three component system protein [Limibacillus halophilus]MBB3066658.1 hypothetical protein [Limibacillus halophilus]
MSEDFELNDIEPQQSSNVPTAAQVSSGIPVPPVRLIEVLSPDDWEAFTVEWLTHHKSRGLYKAIRRYSGPGDRGLDVVAFTSADGFAEPWDSYQCKHYNHALTPEDVCAEVAKVIYHSFNRTPPFNQACRVPHRHVFVSPRGVGITVGRWLTDSETFKTEIKSRWDTQCAPKIGAGISAPLTGDLLSYVDSFDFSIFEDRTGAELIEEHFQTVFYAPRFGGGLPPRGTAPPPPPTPASEESVYLRKLLDAYGDHLGTAITATADLDPDGGLREHYNRQRVLFYSAEALRNFARDRTPRDTFDSLQEDIFNGVIDVCEASYASGLECLRATISTAATVDVGGNALVGVTRVADKQGVCHQLANDDRLTWVDADA